MSELHCAEGLHRHLLVEAKHDALVEYHTEHHHVKQPLTLTKAEAKRAAKL